MYVCKLISFREIKLPVTLVKHDSTCALIGRTQSESKDGNYFPPLLPRFRPIILTNVEAVEHAEGKKCV